MGHGAWGGGHGAWDMGKQIHTSRCVSVSCSVLLIFTEQGLIRFLVTAECNTRY